MTLPHFEHKHESGVTADFLGFGEHGWGKRVPAILFLTPSCEQVPASG